MQYDLGDITVSDHNKAIFSPTEANITELDHHLVGSGDRALFMLRSLICYLREKNVLTRADLEKLRVLVEDRVGSDHSALPCPSEAAEAAAAEMRELDDLCGRKYGGKRSRNVER